MSYVIEDNIPLPNDLGRGGLGRKDARTDWTETLDRMLPGQPTLAEDNTHRKAAENFKFRRPDKRFVIRKVPHVGWRVWRAE